MANPFGSNQRPAYTDPIVEGGTYVYEHKDQNGNVVSTETATISGTETDITSGRVSGNLYHFRRGNMFALVTEGTESFAQWTLVSAPSKAAAASHVRAHKAALDQAEQDLKDAKAARKAS